jgi:hypothetical protein
VPAAFACCCACCLQASLKPLFGLSKGPTGVFKSVLDTNRTDGKRRDEIYVDVVERLAVTFNAAGHAISSQIDGSIQVRCACVRAVMHAHVCWFQYLH